MINEFFRYRDSGGVATTLELAKMKQSRKLAVNMLQQLVLASGSEEDMTVILELLQGSQDFEARLSFIQAIITTLRESHRCRATFRKSGGFVYIVSILLSLDQTLGGGESDQLGRVLLLIREVFNCLTTAMRFEPANARYFQVEIANGVMLLESIQLLGCFSTTSDDSYIVDSVNETPSEEEVEVFEKIFSTQLKKLENLRSELHQTHSELDIKLFNACVVIRMLYDMAIDRYDRENPDPVVPRSPRASTSSDGCGSDTASNPEKRKLVSVLNLSPPVPEPIIVHSGVVTTILQLIPMIRGQSERYSVALQIFSAQLLQSLLRTEKNQQVCTLT